MPRILALVFSYVFHPLWMPLIVFGAAYLLDPYVLHHSELFGLIVGVLVINTLAPGLSLAAMMRFGMISSAEIHKRSERILPFVLILFYFVLAYVILRMKLGHAEPVVMSLFSALLVSVGTAFFITFKWKISIHSLSQGGLVGTLVGLSGLHGLSLTPWIILAVLIAGCVAVSRMTLKAHIPSQTYAGFALACLVHVVMIRYSLYF